MEVNAIKVEGKNNQKCKGTLFELFSAMFWLLFFVNSFVFNIESYIFTEVFPALSWVAHWRILPLSFTILIILIFIKTKKRFFYFIFYPAIALLWEIPFLIFRRKMWYLGIAIVKSFIAVFGGGKFSWILKLGYLCALVLLLCSNNRWLIAIGSIIMFFIIITVLIRQFIALIRPLNGKTKPNGLLSKINNEIAKTYSLSENLKSIPTENYNQEQESEWIKQLQTAVITNRFYLFASKKLKEYKKSNFDYVCKSIYLLLLALIIILSFGFIYYGMYHMNASFFAIRNSQPNVLGFFLFSFDTFASIDTVDIMCISEFLGLIIVVEKVISFIFVAIIIGSILSIWHKNKTNQIDEWINTFERMGGELEVLIKDDYKYDSVDKAIENLKKANSSLIAAIYYLSNRV